MDAIEIPAEPEVEVRPVRAVVVPTAVRSAAPSEGPRDKPHPGWYRVVWRWHFYAGLLTTPFLLILATTGLIYIFSPEIERAFHRDRAYVAVPSDGMRRPMSQLLEAAVDGQTGWKVARITETQYADRSLLVALKATEGKAQQEVYVDPYTAQVLGRQDPETDSVRKFFRFILDLHRRLVLGTTGRVLVEICTCWGALLMATGVYLWWPRRKERVRGVWVPRLRAKPYVVLRDLHTVSAIYLLPVIGLIVTTGLFYSVVWGKGVFAVSTMANAGIAGLSAAEPVNKKVPGAKPLEFAQIEAVHRLARSAYPDRGLFVDVDGVAPSAVGVFAISDFNGATYGPALNNRLTIDVAASSIVTDIPLSENAGRWWHAWTYPLHVGSFWGPTTKVLWSLACLVLIALPITGTWMWWQRRPAGQSGFPRRVDAPWPWWLTTLVIVNCLFFPLAGVTVVLFMLIERGLGRFWRPRNPTQPAAPELPGAA